MAQGSVRQVKARIAEAETHEERERWREAVNAWRALAIDEDKLRFVLRAAIAAESGNLYTEAEQLFREAIQRAPQDASGYLGLGSVLSKLGRLEDACQILAQGLRLNEQQFALTMLGIIQRRLGDLSAARDTLRRSLDLNPDDDEAHFALGLAWAQEQPLLALEHYGRALEIDPQLPNVRREMGDVLQRLGKNEEAETVLQQALAENPADAWTHNYLGHLLSLREDWKSAKKEFAASTEQRPDIGMFWSSLADACAALEEFVEAERYYLKALSLGIDDAYANARYGVLLKYRGQLGKARYYLKRAIDLDPAQRQAAEALADLDHSL
jgi:Flp pilus assembly protein TadD